MLQLTLFLIEQSMDQNLANPFPPQSVREKSTELLDNSGDWRKVAKKKESPVLNRIKGLLKDLENLISEYPQGKNTELFDESI